MAFTGYIVTIVGLQDNMIAFGNTTTAGSKIYYLTIDQKSKINIDGTEVVDLPTLQKEIQTDLITGNTTSNMLTNIFTFNQFKIKYAEKDDGNKIIVSENEPNPIIGGKKRTQHKYSRKR